MKLPLVIKDDDLKISDVKKFVFDNEGQNKIEIDRSVFLKIEKSHHRLLELLEKRIPIYGVTTGLGDSCFRVIDRGQSEELQANLISYLSCGVGKALPIEASKAALVMRLQSLCRGYSGVSTELIERIKLYLENNWIPVIPRSGSLGASGDLIPLAYIACVLQGEGQIHSMMGPVNTSEILNRAEVKPYRLKVKEGLALVNGTSAMAGMSLINLNDAQFILNLAALSSSWLCLALDGKVEAFSVLVNEKAKKHIGQGRVAKKIRHYLDSESYTPQRGQDVQIHDRHTRGVIQDRYSLRCVPQILGPVVETIDLGLEWLELELNSASDNPLISDEGDLEMGGNFYGGYLSHSMDYLKMSLAQIADLYDRQLTFLIDDKSNRGLPANLAAWNIIPENERFLHHGLKGLHQAVNALTSELLANSIPNSIFSRSSESHNQDKVSLGMSGAMKCSDIIETLYTIQSMYFICLAQALDLRKITLKDETSKFFYNCVRSIVPFIESDTALDKKIAALSLKLREISFNFERKITPL